MNFEDFQQQAGMLTNSTIYFVAKHAKQIPGSRVLFKYAYHSYQSDPFRLLLELLLIGFMGWYFVAKSYQPGSPAIVLTDTEINELIQEWEPEPLVQPLSEFERFELSKQQIFTGQVDKKVKYIDGKEKFNFAALNFLGLMNHEYIKQKSIEALRKYGVGTCGPRGFYGTLDVHLELEKKIAGFLGMEASIVYAQGFSCISSVIPAFSKRGDVIVCDRKCNFAIQKGISISRSHVYYYEHNDMQDLERVLLHVQNIRKKLPLARQFLITEGIFINTGEICNLPKLVELKQRFKYRLIVDESLSLGSLGKCGKGVSEHFGVDTILIDILTASMSNALGSNGGFCAGTKQIAEHQRLSGQAYTFSASLPAMLTVACMEALNMVENGLGNIPVLQQNAKCMHEQFKDLENSAITLTGNPASPICHLMLKKSLDSREAEEIILQEIVELCIKDGIVITRSKYCNTQEIELPRPSIRFAVTSAFTKREIEKACGIVKDSIRKTLRKYQIKY